MDFPPMKDFVIWEELANAVGYWLYSLQLALLCCERYNGRILFIGSYIYHSDVVVTTTRTNVK